MLFRYELEYLNAEVPADRAANLERFLNEKQIPKNSFGYAYIAYAVLLLADHPDMDIDRLTAETVRRFDAETAQVQRAMLYAVLMSWRYCGGKKMTVPEFIRNAADWLLAQE